MLVSLAIQLWLTHNPLDDLLYTLQVNNISFVQTKLFLHFYIEGRRLRVPLTNIITGEKYGQEKDS